jgi:hypothetical protein
MLKSLLKEVKNWLTVIARCRITSHTIMNVIGYGVCGLVVVVYLWIALTCTIQRFKCPSMTENELFLNIPQSIVCNWKTN